MMKKKCQIAVLMTCHNRRDLTVASIRALEPAAAGACDMSIVLVDAGSSDGTAEAVAATRSDVRVLSRSADLYWNGGMREAWQHALRLSPDFYLWLNDDLELAANSISRLLDLYDRESERSGKKIIVVGKTIDPDTGSTTYGGLARNSKWSRISFRNLTADEHYCAAMNGNCVLIPAGATGDIGFLSDRYSHALGDIDYGLRAKQAGYLIIQGPEPVGFQRANEKKIYGSQKIKLTPASLRRVLSNPKGIPLRDWAYFCRRHAGPLWPVNFIMRYLRLFRL